MTEEEARAWLAARYPEQRIALLERYVALLMDENRHQNLISKASQAEIWGRHIVDSAQLLGFAPEADRWLDVGSGPGLPGIVIACLTSAPICLVEPRARRVAFLRRCIDALGLESTEVQATHVERMDSGVYGAITARAYAALPDIFESTIRFTGPSTIWILPKGRRAETELEAARATWQGVFHVERSATDEDARIVIARQVQRMKR